MNLTTLNLESALHSITDPGLILQLAGRASSQHPGVFKRLTAKHCAYQRFHVNRVVMLWNQVRFRLPKLIESHHGEVLGTSKFMFHDKLEDLAIHGW